MTKDSKQIEMDTEALEAALAKADNAERARRAFLGVIGHEIRTPLNGITGFVELALAEEQTQSARDYFERIRSCAHQLAEVTENLVDMAAIDSGSFELANEPFRLGRIMESCKASTRKQAARKRVTLSADNEGCGGLTLMGDGYRIRQVLINIISNAIKFTTKGSVHASANMMDEDDDRAVIKFEVRDTGQGMTAGQIRSVLAASGAELSGGVGVGLAITSALIAQMGGQLDIESTVGVGSVFSFILPFNKAEETAGEAPVSEMKRPSFSSTVLVCEDNSANRLIINGHLSKVGIRAVNAENGLQAIEAFENAEKSGTVFDLILMDIQMPIMDGYTATRRLREKGYSAPIIALTANTMPGDKELCLQNGMTDFLPKPFPTQKLWRTLSKYLIPTDYFEPVTLTTETENVMGEERTLDRARGIAYTAGDPRLYEYALADFYRDYMHAVEDIRFMVYGGQIANARRLAHTIKGTAGMIGAEAMHTAACVLETAFVNIIKSDDIANKNTIPDAEFTFFRERLSELLTELSDYAPSDKPRRPKAESKGAPPIREAQIEFASRLENLLASGDATCADYADDIEEVLGDVPKILRDELSENLSCYDFAKALTSIAGVKDFLQSDF